MATKRTKTTKGRTEIDPDTIFSALDVALVDAQSGKYKTISAADVIVQAMDKIEALGQQGLSLRRVYAIMGGENGLGVSYDYFARVIRAVRKNSGSDLYKPRPRKQTEVAGEVPAAPKPETTTCLACGSEAHLLTHKITGVRIWHCSKCSKYYADDNGITSRIYRNESQ